MQHARSRSLCEKKEDGERDVVDACNYKIRMCKWTLW